MTNRVDAVFEKGVFRPTEPVELRDGARVQLQFEPTAAPPQAKPLGDLLDKIAGLPAEGTDDGFCGADHDQILYGGDEGPR